MNDNSDTNNVLFILAVLALAAWVCFIWLRPAHAEEYTVTYELQNDVLDNTFDAPKMPQIQAIPKSKSNYQSTAYSEIPDSKEWQIIGKFSNRQIIADIYKHESSFGAHDVCRTWGKYNGFGYNEWKGHSPTCYSSFEEVVAHVNTWIDDKLDKNWSYNRINCYYVRGLSTESCETAYKLVSME